MSTNTTDAEKEISHPLEDVFDIEENTTVVPYKEVKTELVPHETFDGKDKEIEEQLQDIYDMSLEAFENQQEESDTMEPKFRARNAEVAVQFLKTALEAVQSKSNLKQHKDKVTKPAAGSTTNNLVLSHEALMDLLENPDAISTLDAIDGEYEVTEDNAES